MRVVLPEVTPVEEGSYPLPPGSLLLLYSDGLIERRGEPLDVGMRRLHAILAELSSEPPDTLADRLIDGQAAFHAVAGYLVAINLVVGIFNLCPAFRSTAAACCVPRSGGGPGG